MNKILSDSDEIYELVSISLSDYRSVQICL